MGDDGAATYRAFWPFYLRAHADPRTRACHYFGTTLALLSLIAGLATAAPWWFAGAVVAGYGPAWFGHFVIEKNRPATFGHPVWSLISDFRMLGTWLTGRLGAELEQAGIVRRRGGA